MHRGITAENDIQETSPNLVPDAWTLTGRCRDPALEHLTTAPESMESAFVAVSFTNFLPALRFFTQHWWRWPYTTCHRWCTPRRLKMQRWSDPMGRYQGVLLSSCANFLPSYNPNPETPSCFKLLQPHSNQRLGLYSYMPRLGESQRLLGIFFRYPQS